MRTAALHQATRLRPGLELRCSDGPHPPHVDMRRLPAGLHLVIVLAGDISVACGDRPMRLAPEPGGSVSAWMPLHSSESLERIDQGAGRERKLILSVAHEWLAEAGLNAGRAHLDMRLWASSPRLHGMADSIVRSAQADAATSRLRTECRAIELLDEAFGAEMPTRSRASPDRMQAARELLDSGAADAWSLADIALELGLHENSLQRRFREAHGCTVFDYLRRRKLEHARASLRAGSSVTEAALIAGYGNPANFATAFKRVFGMPPSRAQSAASGVGQG